MTSPDKNYMYFFSYGILPNIFCNKKLELFC